MAWYWLLIPLDSLVWWLSGLVLAADTSGLIGMMAEWPGTGT